MSKTIWTYGAISGATIISTMLIGFALDGESSSVGTSMWLGYLIMIVALSMIFVGVKRYRDRELGGVITFGTAFKVGLGISLVASAVYIAGWELNLALTDHAFIGEYTASVIEEKQREGVTGEELATLREDMEAMKLNYAKPLFRVPMTFTEIFPVGLLIALLSAAILRNRHVLPAE